MIQRSTFSTFMRLFNSSKFIGLVMLFGSVAGYGQTFPGNDDIPGTNKTFNVPVGVTSITATAWGGGGGGGASNTNGKGGNGGGGGGATTKTIAVSEGNIFNYTVGYGGDQGGGTIIFGSGNGSDGGNSTISSSNPATNMIANGGKGGLKNSQNINPALTSAGGTATGGSTNVDGKQGIQGGNTGGDGGNSATINGIFGAFGAGGSNGPGSPGINPGGGGGGGERGGLLWNNGRPGANGRVSFQFIQVTDAVISTNCVVNTIIITGNYFAATGTTSVEINGVACTVTSVTSSKIIATLPANATSGQVVVTNANRTNNGKTVTVIPAILDLSLSPLSATVCKNSIQPIKATTTSTNVTWLPITNLYTDAACTTPYVANTHASTVWAKPSVTTTYTATATSGACTKTAAVKYTVENAIWNGSAWSPSPKGVKSLEFKGDYSQVEDIDGCDCTVTSGNVVIATGKVLKLQNELNVNGGSMTFENNASLLQINNVANTGTITYKRTATGIKGSDFVYWSSPVANQAIGSFYSGQGPKYSWNTLANNGNGNGTYTGQGNWVNPPATMAPGIGYIVRGSSSFGMAAHNILSTFTGIPNNGTIPVTVSRGSYTGTGYPGANGIPINNLDDNYNLLGNPYPSAIDALKFLDDNKGIIEGNVKLWKHGFDPSNGASNPFYGSFAYNYSASDYVTINATGATDTALTPIIKSGQAFFVVMLDGSTDSKIVNFKNSQRSNIGTPYANDAFFRTTNPESTTSETIERNRIWLDLVDANNIAETTLVGYVSGATDAKESAYDAIASSLPMGIYSLIADETFVIQGRSTPFNTNDQVAIGFNTPTAGSYKIAINTIDGLFLDATQNIYIEDKTTGIIHNLKTSPYSFTAPAGTFNNRFVLRYTNETLKNEDFTTLDVKVYANENIQVNAGNQTIKTVRVYDLLGRVLGNFTNVNTSTFNTTSIAKTQTALLVEVLLENGAAKTYKVIF